MQTKTQPRGMLSAPRPGQPFNCWIDPGGQIHLVGLWGHSEFAAETCRNQYNFDEDFYDGHKAVEELHQRGWARVHTRSNQSYAQIVVPNEQRVPKRLLDGIYEAYRMSEYPEIGDWLRGHEVGDL